MFSDPVFERISDERIHQVDKPLLRNLSNLTQIRNIIKYNKIVGAPLQNISGGETFVLRHRQMFSIFAGNV